MLSFLTPAALWLLPLVAALLVLHFLGRPRPVPRDFPSLLPVRESLREAMRRHRVRNWLQLVLRMLILACLALAAAGPVWRPDGALPPPDTALVLRHNGAYARLPLEENEEGADRMEMLADAAARRIRTLEALARGNTLVEPLVEGREDGADRHGDLREALTRLVRRGDAAARAGATELHVEVFDGTGLDAIAETVLPWLSERPQARLVLLDRTREAGRLSAFGTPRVRVDAPEAPGRAPRLTISVPVAPEARRAPLWAPHGILGEGAPRTTRWQRDTAFLTLPLPDSGWVAGAFRLAGDDPARARFAFTERAIAIGIPPAGDLCRTEAPAAAALAASLGGGGSRLRPRVVTRPEDADRCRVLALADPSDAELPLAPAARAVVRRGGLVLFEAGPRTAIAAWNRALLEPLEAGRLMRPLDAGPDGARVEPHAAGLRRAGLRTTSWGMPGTVRRVLGFQAGAGTDTLLATHAAPDGAHPRLPVLLRHAAHGGELLVWTTPLDAGAWGDIGAGPWPALLHHAFGTRAHATETGLHQAATDSLAALPASARRMTGPDGQETTFRDGARVAGPFGRAGLYRLDDPGAPDAPAAWLATFVEPDGRAPDWRAFEATAGAAAPRVTRVANDLEWKALRDGRALRMPLLLLAALLLFAEGLATLRLAPSARFPEGKRMGATSPRR